MTRLRKAGLALACALLAAAPAASAEAPEWRKVEGSLRQAGDVPALEQLARDHPYSSNVRLALLNAYLQAGAKDAAWREIEFLASRGYVFGAAGQAGLLGAYDGIARDKLAELFEAERSPIEASQLVATIPAEAQLVEAAVLDPATGRMFASTIVSQALFVGQADGRWSRMPLVPGSSLGGLAFDASREVVWAGSGAYDESPAGERPFRGVIGFDLAGVPVRFVAGPADSTA
ncbi:MAG TPA: hypothetical protein VI168_13500, partial [Croceibacterium sp.]